MNLIRGLSERLRLSWRLPAAVLAVAVFGLLTACGGDDDAPVTPAAGLQQADPSPSAAATEQASFPRTVNVEGAEVTIESEPIAIAILSPSIGEAAYKLIDPSRIVAVSSTLENPLISNVADLVKATPKKLPSGHEMDPEQVLALEPDLVLVQPSHEAERDATAILNQAGIPVVSLSDWDSIISIRENFLVLGEVLGAEAKAAEIAADIDAKLARIDEALEGVEEKPVVLPLVGFTNPLMYGPGTIVYDEVVRAGGINATDMMNAGQYDQADVEKIIAANPDYIVLVDFQGTGEAGFASIIDHPGMQAVKAVQEGNVKVFPGNIMLSTGTNEVIDGIVAIAEWIYPDQFAQAQ